jgi:hypothetical protein
MELRFISISKFLFFMNKIFFVALFIIFLFKSPILAQNFNEEDFKSGVIYAQPVTAVQSVPDFNGLIEGFGNSSNVKENLNLAQAVSLYFNTSCPTSSDFYNPKLVDWVIYIDQKGNVAQTIIGDGVNKAKNGQKMSKERNIWVVVFADFPTLPVPNGNTSNINVNFTVSHSAIGKYYSTAETLLYGLASVKAGTSAASTTVLSESVTLTASPIYDLSVISRGVKKKTKHLYLFAGMARLALSNNSVNRCSLIIPPDVSKYFSQLHPRLVGNTFGNADKEIFGLSLALASYHTGSWPFFTDINPNLYLLAHWFLFPPERPWNYQSLSVFAGTEISLSTPFSQIAAGINYSPNWDTGLGFFLGTDLIKDSDNYFKLKWFYGINYFL